MLCKRNDSLFERHLVSSDGLTCSNFKENKSLRVNTRLNELCGWTLFAVSQGASVHSKFWRTDLRSARKKKENNYGGKEGYEWRDNHAMHPFGSPFCDVTREQTNKRFHWTALTVTNTHFNRLQIYGWTSLAAHFQIAYFICLICIWLFLMVVEIIHCISLWEGGRTAIFPSLGGVVPIYLC